MATLLDKMMLLVSGIARNNDCNDFSNDLINIIHLFGVLLQNSHTIHWLIEGEEFQTIFSTKSHRTHFSRAITKCKQFEMHGISFKVIADSNKTSMVFSILHESLPKNILSLKISVEIDHHETTQTAVTKVVSDEKKKCFAFTNVTSKRRHKLLVLYPGDDIIRKHHQYTINIGVDIKEINYHRKKVEDTLKWKLNKEQIDMLNNGKESISMQTENWSLCIETIHGQFSRLSIVPLNMHSDIRGIQIKYNLVIINDDNQMQTKGAVNLYDHTEEIHTWNRLTIDSKFEIALAVKIVNIFWISKAGRRERWYEYGFVE